MNNNYIEELMLSLYETLTEASKNYYNGKLDSMTDAEYDDKLNLLAALEKQYPHAIPYILENSPTQKVGYGGISESLEKVEHPKKMLSLDKRYDMTEITEFFKEMYPIVGSLKADGLTVVLTYENHILVDAVTRGNGEVGERILKAARTFSNLPMWIPFAGTLVLRAEAVISQEQFERINEECGGLYKTARNLVSGTVRNLDPNVVATRQVQVYVFEVVEYEAAHQDIVPEEVSVSDYAQRQWVETLGFTCVEYDLLEQEEQVQSFHDLVENYRENGYPYGTDGIVFCTDSIAKKRLLGSTAKYPLYALAFKFPNKGQTSTVTGISWQAGMYSLTPVVSMNTLLFDGVSVQKATAHNLYFLLGKDAKGSIVRPPIVPGCQIKVERSGEVIPKIAQVFYEGMDMETYTDLEELYPHRCPVCGAPTAISGVELCCSNPNCSGKLKAKLRTAVSRNALNITGIGEKAIHMLVDQKFIQYMDDLFRLEQCKERLVLQDGYGEQKVGKILKELHAAKQAPLPNVLAALCIKGVGLEVARQLATIMPHGLIDIFSFSKGRLISLDGIGDVLADNILDFLNYQENINYIAMLIHCGYGNPIDFKEKASNALEGLTICISGTLSVDRKTMEAFIRDNGGKPVGSVSGKTSYILLGSSPGASKVEKAKSLSVPEITEKRLRQMVQDNI